MKIDHVSIASSNLDDLDDEFANLGMKADYGGPHSNGVTHMSLLGFDDGSYIELISVMKPVPSPVWAKYIAENGGPCSWAVEVDDISSEVARVRSLGITATGPEDYNRKRPDGVLVEWQLGFIGDKPPGSTLPFLITDKTPREYRVKPSSSVSRKANTRGTLRGLEKVVLGVSDLEKGIELFKVVYGWNDPKKSDEILEGAIVADYENTPVALASPKDDKDWLSKRLARFGDCPCTFLIGTDNLQETRKKYALSQETNWFSHPVAWTVRSKLNGSRLGFVE